MNRSKINSAPEKKAKAPEHYDVLKDVRKIMRGDFPKMRRMKRRLAVEIAAMFALVIICGWMNYTLPYSTLWITLIIIAFMVAFMTLEVFAFRAYWYTPSDISYADSMRKISNRLNSVTNPMKVINFSLALTIIGFLFIDNSIVRILSWQTGILLLVVMVSFSVFSARWISYAKLARRQTRLFQKTKKIN